MGWRFDIRYTNLVAYLTIPNQDDPPRVTAHQLREFLGSIQGEYRDRPPLWSEDPAWVIRITKIANQAARFIDSRQFQYNEFLNPNVVRDALIELRLDLGHFDLFALAVGSSESAGPLTSFCEHGAYSSGHKGLFLIPDLPAPHETLELFDPLPITRIIMTRQDLWPGILFWTRTGVSAFASLREAYGLYQQILDSFRDAKSKTDHIISSFNKGRQESGTKRLLHLSDLHFGTPQALQNQAYLSSHLRTKLDSFHRVVITGDLFDNAQESDALAFRSFRANLEANTGKEVIVIPGNHDQSVFGNKILGIGSRLKELSKLEWSSLIVDDDLKCVFYCFDSARDGENFATGRVTREQMIDVAELFETKCNAKPELRQYLAVALVHHHPYSFNSKAETLLQRGLELFGVKEESLLRMHEAENFINWCAGRRVPLVLHGHKHIPRYVEDRIQWTHGLSPQSRDVTAVGCGTSLGVEGYQLSYNVLEWSPSTKKWTASFFSDPGFGSGFEEIFVSVHSTATI